VDGLYIENHCKQGIARYWWHYWFDTERSGPCQMVHGSSSHSAVFFEVPERVHAILTRSVSSNINTAQVVILHKSDGKLMSIK
jgi:hypothetical protein